MTVRRTLSLKDAHGLRKITLTIGPVQIDNDGDYTCKLDAPMLLPPQAVSRGVDALQALMIGIVLLTRIITPA
jgi:hypothetical protein